MAQEPVRITVQSVLEDLNNGYTRTTSDKHYQGEGKSIEEKYGLNKTQVSQLFKHDKLKGRKTKVASTPAFILVDEDEESGTEDNNTSITESESEKDISGINDTEEETTTEQEDSPSWL